MAKTTHGVDYYNKEITKNNKEITKYKVDLSLSSGLVADAPQVNPEVADSQENSTESGFETLPDEIKPENVKRAVVQLWYNQGSRIEYKLKIRLNMDFGQGEEHAEFIAPVTKNWSNFVKYHPQVSKHDMITWTRQQRKELSDIGIKSYQGKFSLNQGWRDRANFNQKEPWTSSVVWYNPNSSSWYALVRIYAWEEVFELSKDGLSAQQAKCKGQKIWMNPLYYKIQRPLTWAQQRKQKK
jgi:hypothetical protein